MDSEVFIHGGFENETPNIPTDSIVRLDSNKLLGKTESLNKIPEAKIKLDQQRTVPKAPRWANKTPEIRLALQVLVSMGGENFDNYDELVKKVPIENLQEEGKRIGIKPLPPNLSKAQTHSDSVSFAILEILFRSHE